MFTSSYIVEKHHRERQREMLARAERQGVARQVAAQPRTAESIERPMRRVRRALRAVFA